MRRNSASFRDPSGYVIEDGESIYRVILPCYGDDWYALKTSGFLDKASELGLIPFRELERAQWPEGIDSRAVAVLQSDRLPFISYPFEWSFSQLKEAAILTLRLHLAALEYGYTLKDATAYNVQFDKGKPVFIDLLSFEKLRPGKVWEAYGQFCAHFLAPLALMSLADSRYGQLSKNWIDGIPLELASQILPFKSKLSPGLAMHLHWHASMRSANAKTKNQKKERAKGLNAAQMRDLASSLLRTIQALKSPVAITEWGDYYSDTNYTEAARKAKEEFMSRAAKSCRGKLAVDLGANDGRYSRLLAESFETVIAADMDHTAVERNWLNLGNDRVLPIVLDLANPSPAIGWGCDERKNIFERCKADLISTLALCHHLRITANIPVVQIAAVLAKFVKPGGVLVFEFVPKTDSQIERMLSRRDDIFTDYSLEDFICAFEGNCLRHKENLILPESERSLHIFRKEA